MEGKNKFNTYVVSFDYPSSLFLSVLKVKNH
ncbi:protein [Escherichia coli]|uniref:Protein n=1 Tax=Escherichia coli TaxID=562 RepID=A0A376U041_ECOLX|nr:protein [Escherichia coli]